MARKSNFGEILRDPLVLALLGTNTAINAANSYSKIKAEGDPNTAKFVNAAMLSGQPVTTLPKSPGLFTSIGKFFGAGPNIEATPETMLQEQLALRQQQQTQEKEAIEARRALGPEGMEAALRGGAFGNAASGMFPGGTVIPTPAEAKASTPYKTKTDITERPITAEGAPDYTRPEKRVPSDQATADPGYMFSGYSRAATPDDSAAKAAAVTTATLNAKDAHEDNRDAREITKGGQYYDQVTGERPPKGLKKKDLPANYIKLTDKGFATMQDARQMNAGFDELQQMVDNKLVKTKGMNGPAAQEAIRKREMAIKYGAGFSTTPGLKYIFRATDPEDAGLVNVGGLLAIQMITKMQHRYPNTKELDAAHNLIGDMSGMSWEVATENINRAKRMANGAVTGLLHKDSGEAGADAASEAVDGWKTDGK